MANEVILKGWDDFQRKLDSLPGSVPPKIDAIVFDEALKWAGLASRSAPRNKIVGLGGTLVRGIRAARAGMMEARVTSQARYSPYVEWGTGGKVSVPADLQKYAIQFKGSRSVPGQRPQPYFFVHKPAIEVSLTARIKKYLNTPQ